MHTWKAKPSHEEVERFLAAWFKQLAAGELEQAEAAVAHAFPDWNESIYTTWQDHYLIHEAPADSSFEGREWTTNRAWLKDLSAQEKVEWMKDDLVWVDFVYRGEPSGYIGEFAVKQGPDGWYVERVIFKMA